jgi:hypothetical protein
MEKHGTKYHNTLEFQDSRYFLVPAGINPAARFGFVRFYLAASVSERWKSPPMHARFRSRLARLLDRLHRHDSVNPRQP